MGVVDIEEQSGSPHGHVTAADEITMQLKQDPQITEIMYNTLYLPIESQSQTNTDSDSADDGSDTYRYPNGDTYLGCLDSKNNRTGFGKYTHATTGATYEGCFEANIRHGHGVLLAPNYLKYIGSFFQDKIHGAGTFIYEDCS
ncbi:MAG: hypothetical protein GY874_03940 [Desulfobacteraceae bacterium]|nr:hypothetical protein [Desulfobacteraceae bacterium]